MNDLALRAARRRAARTTDSSPSTVSAPLPAERAAVLQEQLHADFGNQAVADSLATGVTAGADAPSPDSGNRAMLRQMRHSTSGVASAALARLPSGGRPLPERTRARMEAAFGHDFGHVRVHTGGQAAKAAEDLQAYAFALGADLFFGPGTFAPETPAGDRLLAHELTHVVQHDEGRLPTGGGVSSPSDATEQEAYGNEDAILSALPAIGAAPEASAVTAPTAAPAATAHRTEAPTETSQTQSEGEGEEEEEEIDPEVLMQILGQAEEFAEPVDVEQGITPDEDEEEEIQLEIEPELDGEDRDEADPQDGEASTGDGDGDDAPTELPESPLDPSAVPENTAPPVEAVDLTGDTPLAVGQVFEAASPTQHALSMGDLGPGLQSGVDNQHAALVDETPELHATLTTTEVSAEDGETTLSSESTADLEGVTDGLDTTPVETEVEEADPGEAADVDTSGVTSAFAGVADDDQEGMARAIGDALGSVPSRDGDIDTTLVTPDVTLEGEADLANAATALGGAVAESTTALTDAQTAVVEGPGPETVQLQELDEPYAVDMPEAPAVEPVDQLEPMSQYLEWDLPSDVHARFDEMNGPEMQASAAEATAELQTAEADYDAQKADAIATAETDVSSANLDHQLDQQDAVSQARSDIDTAQRDTLAAQEAAVRDARTQMDTERARVEGDARARVQADQTQIDTRYRDAQSEADTKVREGEDQARRMEEDAQREAENQSWWDKAVSAVTSLLEDLCNAILDLWSEIRDAVAEVLDAAVQFASDLIDACLAFVVELLDAYCDFLKLLVQELLGDIFPELAEALCEAIDSARDWATQKLTEIAEALKAAVQLIADALLAALDGLIALIEAGLTLYQGLITALLTGDWAYLAEMALRAVLAVCGIPYDDFVGTFGQVVEIWDQIVEDPGAIVRNGLEAMVQGFTQFGNNFLDHFIGGAVEWITGASDLVMPDSFDLAGIFDVTCQVLGLTYDHLRDKAVEHLGEGAVTTVEKVYEGVMALMEGGWGGLWDYVKGELVTLVDDVVIAIGTWLVEKAILVGARWIAGLAATFGLSAIVEALIAAWQFAMWVKDQIADIWGIVEATINSIHEFVMGNIGPAANKIEGALADCIPPAIDLVAKLLNIANIADKVQDIIEGVREMIDNAIDTVITTVLETLGLKSGEEDEEGEFDGELGENISFTAGGEGHRQWIDGETPYVASTPMPVTQRLADWRSRLSQDPSEKDGEGGPTDQTTASTELTNADKALGDLATEVTEAADVIKQADTPEEQAAAATEDDQVETAQQRLVTSLTKLFGLFQDEAPAVSFGDPVTFTGADGQPHTLAVAGSGGTVTVTIDGGSPSSAISELRRFASGDADLTSAISAYDRAIEDLEITALSMQAGEDASSFESDKSAAATKAAKVVGAKPDPLTRFAADIGTAHANAQDGIRTDLGTPTAKDTYGTMADWSAVKTALKTAAGKVQAMADKPVSQSEHTFGGAMTTDHLYPASTGVFSQLTSEGKPTPKKSDRSDHTSESFAEGQKSNINDGSGHYPQAKSALVGRIFQDGNLDATSTTQNALYAHATDDSEGHHDYDIRDETFTITPSDVIDGQQVPSGDPYTVSYTTVSGDTFSATVQGGLIRTMKGDGLTLRGYADDESIKRGAAPDRSGSLRTKKQQEDASDSSHTHNSAHLIADRFRGTGDGKGRNLVTTSDTYNADAGQENNSMAWAENRIAEWIRTFDRGLDFTLEVSLTWGGLKDSAFVQAVVADALAEGESLTPADVEAEVDRYLAAHPGTKLQRVMSVTYKATLDGNTKTWTIGPDKWLTR